MIPSAETDNRLVVAVVISVCCLSLLLSVAGCRWWVIPMLASLDDQIRSKLGLFDFGVVCVYEAGQDLQS